jgi:hypothetical protein
MRRAFTLANGCFAPYRTLAEGMGYLLYNELVWELREKT